MQYRKLPGTNEMISALGFGCMRLPEKGGKIDFQKASELVYEAIDLGVNYFDTAYPYHMGESEPFVGKVLKPHRDKVLIATKLPPLSVKKKEDMAVILDNQLRRLDTDHIDFYMLHGIDGHTWEKFVGFDILEFLSAAKKSGKIRYAGFSYHGYQDMFKKIIDAEKWDFCMIQYNFLDEGNQAGKEGLIYASRKNMGVFIMEPLRGGSLAKKQPAKIEKIYGSSGIDRTPASWALKWVYDHPQVTMLLSGMNSREQLHENVETANNAAPSSMGTAELEIIGKVRDEYNKTMKINCTACGYCIPCPAKVNIPVIFDIYNRQKVFGEKKFDNMARYVLQMNGMDKNKKNREFASNCTGCGICEKKCPQHLPIRNFLNEARKEFETLTLKFFIIFAGILFNRIK